MAAKTASSGRVPTLEVKPGALLVEKAGMEDQSPVMRVLCNTAAGLADPERGRVLRQTLKVYLDEFDQNMDKPVRSECTRLASQALALAHGVGTGAISPKAIRP